MHERIEADLHRESHFTLSRENEMMRNLILNSKRKVFEVVYRKYFKGGERVLEVGSGRGLLRRNLPSDFRGEWLQLDLESRLLGEARKEVSSGSYVCGTAHELPFPTESFDAVVGFNSYNILDSADLLKKDREFNEKILLSQGLTIQDVSICTFSRTKK